MGNGVIENVLQTYLERLRSVVSRGPLLNASTGVDKLGRGGRLDVSMVNCFWNGAAVELVKKVVNEEQLLLEPNFDNIEVDDGEEDFGDGEKVDRICRQVDRHFVIEARKIERETGNRCVWFGYPLLYLREPMGRGSILAPVILWPIRVSRDRNIEMGIHVEPDKNADGPVVNEIMKAWVKGRLDLYFPNLVSKNIPRKTEEIDEPDVVSRLWEWLKTGLEGVQELNVENLPNNLFKVQRLRSPGDAAVDHAHALDDGEDKAKLLNSAVMGVMRWQNQSLISDIEELLKLKTDGDGNFENPFAGFAQGETLTEQEGVDLHYQDEADRHHVVEADYSQEGAVLKSRENPGVLIQGPPGTGKSQTITNMIADEIVRGGSVLVVCQKRAAIDVVAKNLEEVGLQDLCLLVHDSSGDRKRVIDELRGQIDDLRNNVRGEGNGDIRNSRNIISGKIDEIEARLDRAYKAFGRKRDCGLTPCEIMRKLVAYVGEVHGTELDDLWRNMTNEELEDLVRQAEEVGRLYAKVKPERNPWTHRHSEFTLTPSNREYVGSRIDECIALDEEHMAVVNDEGVGFEIDEDIGRFAENGERLRIALGEVVDNQSIAEMLRWYSSIWESEETKIKVNSAVRLADEVMGTNVDEILGERVPVYELNDLAEMVEKCKDVLEYRGRGLRWLSRRYRTLRNRVRSMMLRNGLVWDWEDVSEMLKLLSARLCRERLRVEVVSLGFGDVGDDVEYIAFARQRSNWLRQCEVIIEEAGGLGCGNELIVLMRNGDYTGVVEWDKSLKITLRRCEVVVKLVGMIEKLDSLLKKEVLVPLVESIRYGQCVNEKLREITSFLDVFDELREYERLMSRYREDEVTNRVINWLKSMQNIDDEMGVLVDKWSCAIRQSALEVWRRQAEEEDEHDGEDWIHGETLEQKRQDLSELLKNKRKSESANIRTCLLEKQRKPNLDVTTLPELLRLRGRNARRLREVVGGGLELGLQWLRPCFLTNPETASQILPLKAKLFDLVIFDEASQLPLEQAMPAIYRGKRIVVAGDRQQLPPTSFFQTGWDDNINGEEEDALAGGGIALDALGIELAMSSKDLLELSEKVLPDHMLEVHYRSKHPLLIEFSNRAYYRGRLEAAYPAQSGVGGIKAPICVKHVNGVYDNQKNRIEAVQVVEILKEMWCNGITNPPTIGVVTFNKKQEEMIEDELTRQSRRDMNFMARYEDEMGRKDGDKDVGFFVKNLESVQGDERDVIIFSTTFGPTERGRHETFRRQFGPLTNQGGERRLNVAVTRARKGIVVVTSMPFNRIGDCGNVIEPGREVKARDFLHVYMNYAQAVSNADEERIKHWLNQAGTLGSIVHGEAQDHYKEFDSEFEEQVYNALKENGWKVDTQVGEAGFRIDLAVRHPNNDRGYILGIECDGAMYHSSRSARTRDVWRQEILEDCGWKIYRIWSTKWWNNREIILQDINDILRSRVNIIGQEEEQETWANVLGFNQMRGGGNGGDEVGVIIDRIPELATVGGGVEEWVEKLTTAIRTSKSEKKIGEWKDIHGQIFILRILEQRRTPFLQLVCGNDVVDQFSVYDADNEDTIRVVEQLRKVSCHDDIVEWFENLRVVLHGHLDVD